MLRTIHVIAIAWALSIHSASTAAREWVPKNQELAIKVTDPDGNVLPCRIHLKDSEQKVIKVPQQPLFWHDHFVFDGELKLQLPEGKYFWEIEKGPEFERKKGTIQLSKTDNQIRTQLKRISNLRARQWFSADLHVHRNPRDVPTLMRAEDLDFAPVITWWNRPAKNIKPVDQTLFRFDQNRVYTNMGGEDEREGGALLFFGLNRPLDLTVKSREYPSPMEFVRQAREWNPRTWIDIEKPFWWDVPVWLAADKMNSIGIANNHMCRSQMLANEAWGKPRDVNKLPGPLGNGYWSQQIYYHILNCGIRIPPSAGSASGVLPNPVGYNRVYAYCPNGFSRDQWFEALRKGNVFVTNGPLMIVKANESVPGRTFRLSESDKTKGLKFDFFVDLTTNDPIKELAVIQNGEVIKTVPCTDDRTQQLKFSVRIHEDGWFLVRALTNNRNTFRFASTAPWYVQSSEKRSISRKSARFFLDWTRERIERLKMNVTDRQQLSQVIKDHDRALDFWQSRLDEATRD